ncbi:outer membrane beta-barrel protein [Jiulongibacter sediminis]|uniref:outer membrane beta-barrel protein n=1 Tax=Jiulongibacter sediminis TaxID=1605367 RepID=UPI0006DCA7C6|nr:outer membrane beta-barrel protein [Jiulongibacter sediminis]
MKNFVLATLVFLCTFAARAEIKRDTTIIEFSDKKVNKRITVISTGEKEIDLPVSMDLNEVLKELGIDTTEREKALVLLGEDNGKKDTLLLISQSGQRIQIVTKQPLLNRAKDTTIVDDYQEPPISNEREPDQWNSGNDWDKQQNQKREEKPKRFFSKSDFGFYIGLNNFVNASSGNSTFPELRTWRSRYVALSFRKNATLLRGKSADLALSYGPEIAWYNFMFENSKTAYYNNEQVRFDDADFSTSKSKLVMPYLNFPVLLNLGFKEDKFKFGVGGYIGYRIGSYTKTKDTNGNKEKNKSTYGFNNVPYGLTAELGRKNGLTLFFRYDLTKTFRSNQTNVNDLQAFSAGLRL